LINPGNKFKYEILYSQVNKYKITPHGYLQRSKGDPPKRETGFLKLTM